MAVVFDSRNSMLQKILPKNSVIAEIGIFTGEFTQFILNNLEPKKLYAVDPYTSGIGVMGSGDVNGFNMEFFDLDLLYKFVKNRFITNSNLELCREYGTDFLKRIPDGHLDAIYLDGDHSFENVANELEIARYKVKEGGWIMGHDYKLNPEKGNIENTHYVNSVVDAFCKKYNLTVESLGNDGIVSFAIKNSNKYKFSITSYSDRPQLFNQTFMRFQNYANLHSYNYKLFNHIDTSSDRHPSWYKLLCLKDLMSADNSDIDYFVWIDDDIYITDMNKSLSDFVDMYNFKNSEAIVLLTDEPVDRISAKLNGGFWILKNCPSSRKFLDVMWEFPNINALSKMSFGYEQEALEFYYRYNCRSSFMIVPQPSFQTTFNFDASLTWKMGDFSAHLQFLNLSLKLQALSLLKKQLGEN
jgi:hypothetical protein